MKLTVLGSGCIIPQSERLPSAYLLESERNRILVDLGPGIFRSLSTYLQNPFSLSHIFLTHLHQDHFSDFWPFLFAIVWARDYYEVNEEINVLVHENFKNIFEELRQSNMPWLNKVRNINFNYVTGGDEIQFPSFSVRCSDIQHTPESLAYTVNMDKKQILFTGDTSYNDTLVNLFKGVDLAITECSFGNENRVEKHLYPEAVKEIIEQSGVSKIVLSHFYPGTDSVKSFKNLLKSYKNVIAAHDGMVIKL